MEGLHFDKELWKDPEKFEPGKVVSFMSLISFYPKMRFYKASFY